MSHIYPCSPNPSTDTSAAPSVPSPSLPLPALASRSLNEQPRTTDTTQTPQPGTRAAVHDHHGTNRLYVPEQYAHNQQQQQQPYPAAADADATATTMAEDSVIAASTSLPSSLPGGYQDYHGHVYSHGYDHGHGHGHGHSHGQAYYTTTTTSSYGPVQPLPQPLSSLPTRSAPQPTQTQTQPTTAAQPAQPHQPPRRSYRPRRKDPSCDLCRERKVKCDAVGSTSCSECVNRRRTCRFNTETAGRRTTSLRQMQDLESEKERLRREHGRLQREHGRLQRNCDTLQHENERLRRLLLEHGVEPGGGLGLGQQQDAKMADADQKEELLLLHHDDNHRDHHDHRILLPLPVIPAIGSNPPRRHRLYVPTTATTTTTTTTPPTARPSPGGGGLTMPLLDLRRTRSNLRVSAKGVWAPAYPLDQPQPAPPPLSSTNHRTPFQPHHHPLPPRDAADVLLRAYYVSVQATLPMVHWPIFQRHVDQLYASAAAVDEGNPPPPPPPDSFVALFYAVLAVGGLFCTYFSETTVSSPLSSPTSPSSPSSPSSSPLSPLSPPHAKQWPSSAVHLAEAARSLLNPWSLSTTTTTTTTTHSLDDVRTLLLLAMFLEQNNLHTAARTWLASAVSVAQALGLYRDPGGGGATSLLETEMRRRVWWAVYTVDRRLALAPGNRPMLICDDDCDVALPVALSGHDDEEEEDDDDAMKSMLATVHVMRALAPLGRLLSSTTAASGMPPSPRHHDDSPTRYSSLSGVLTSSSSPPLSSQSSQSSQASQSASTSTAPQTVSAMSAAGSPVTSSSSSGTTSIPIPAEHLAVMDRYFDTCLEQMHHTDDDNDGSGDPANPQRLGPLIHLLHARLVLHRHNLCPTSTAMQTTTRLAALEQCTRVALDTACVLRRRQHVPPGYGYLASGAGATALLATHLMRCTPFLLLGGLVSDALVLVDALAEVAAVRREVAVPCGRWLACFVSSLSYKRAEYTTYLSRTPPLQAQAQAQTVSTPQVYDALRRDEELLVYVSADMQSSPDSSWVWEGEVPRGAAVVPMMTTAAAPTPPSNCLAHIDSRMGLTSEESRDWGGWESLKGRIQKLEASPVVKQESQHQHYYPFQHPSPQHQHLHSHSHSHHRYAPHPGHHHHAPYEYAVYSAQDAKSAMADIAASAIAVEAAAGSVGRTTKREECMSIANIICVQSGERGASSA